MTDPTTQHLYVMQNEHGCIKIGRSLDPWRRVHALRQSEHCRVELIAAFDGGGDEEEGIHIDLEKFRLLGEWFDGTDEARTAIADIFSPVLLQWQFDHDPVGRERWLKHFRVARDAAYIRSAIARQLEHLRRKKCASDFSDSGIFYCRYLAENGMRPALVGHLKKGRSFTTWHNPETGKPEEVPAYSSNVDLALLAWPEHLRPASWTGSAIDCCIAALVAIRTALPKVPKMQPE